MTIFASNIASQRAAPAKGPDLQFNRTYALVAIHAARHMTCPAYAPLRTLLVSLLMMDGHSHADAYQHADDLISVATSVIVSVEASEPRMVPWPGGQHVEPFVQAMYELETSK
ncbi:hypothetical protein AB0I81_30155 [Nonomuraea sp. NPDC050404]|uniref:hypothetical protein n=1 Tax=Nonomuraea sp. NPDC050404 TaxID=3155783 RepID=UPI0033FA82C2